MTPLQAALERRYLNRGFDEAMSHLSSGFDYDQPRHEDDFEFRGIQGEVERVLKGAVNRCMRTPELTIVDAGCGTGRAISEGVIALASFTQEELFRPVSIHGIGIDQEPLPHLMEPKIDSSKLPDGCTVDLRADDVTTFSTIGPESVDILYSMGCLQYVEDVLRALEAGWRVLKPGGVMVWHTTASTNSEPPLGAIFRQTPGANEVFAMVEDGGGFHEYPTRDVIVGRKKRRAKFKGFPFVLEPSFASEVPAGSRYDYVKTGRYRSRD